MAFLGTTREVMLSIQLFPFGGALLSGTWSILSKGKHPYYWLIYSQSESASVGVCLSRRSLEELGLGCVTDSDIYVHSIARIAPMHGITTEKMRGGVSVNLLSSKTQC